MSRNWFLRPANARNSTVPANSNQSVMEHYWPNIRMLISYSHPYLL